jgi:ribosomal protein S18 acetylase RimI-like enzyme
MNDKSTMVVSRDVQLAELPRLAEIYALAFPEQLRVRLGNAVCRRYLETVMLDKDYQVCVARVDGQIVGFGILNLDAAKKPSRFWVLRSWPFVLLGFAREPLFWCRRLFNAVRGAFQRHPANGSPSGSATVSHGRNLCYLDFIGVAPEARRKGLAQMLLAQCMSIAKEREGCKVLRLTVNHANHGAVKLYEGFGFKELPHHAESNSSIYEILL